MLASLEVGYQACRSRGASNPPCKQPSHPVRPDHAWGPCTPGLLENFESWVRPHNSTHTYHGLVPLIRYLPPSAQKLVTRLPRFEVLRTHALVQTPKHIVDGPLVPPMPWVLEARLLRGASVLFSLTPVPPAGT